MNRRTSRNDSLARYGRATRLSSVPSVLSGTPHVLPFNDLSSKVEIGMKQEKISGHYDQTVNLRHLGFGTMLLVQLDREMEFTSVVLSASI